MELGRQYTLDMLRRPRSPFRSQSLLISRKWGGNLSSKRMLADKAPIDELPASKRLPQSPLITHPRPDLTQSRKSRPTHADKSELEKNPWAVALASPVRMCTVTGARIPRDLLGEWGLVRKPDTENHYLLPVGLMKDALRTRPKTETVNPEEISDSHAQESITEDSMTPKSIRNEKPGQQLLLRMMNSMPLLQRLSKPLSRNSGKRPAIGKILPFRWKHPFGPITSRVEKQLLWRPDMVDYVLEQRRKGVVENLEKAQRRHARLDQPNGAWTVLQLRDTSVDALSDALSQLGALDRMAAGVVLLLSPTRGIPRSPETVYNPTTQSEIPVFDLSVLLAASDLAKLRKTEAQHFHQDALFFRPDNRLGVDTVLSLWSLQRYMAGIVS